DAGTKVQYFDANTTDGTLLVACETGKLYGIDVARAVVATNAKAIERMPDHLGAEPPSPYEIMGDAIYKDRKPASKHYASGRFVTVDYRYVTADGDYFVLFGDTEFKAAKMQLARVSLDGVERWVTPFDRTAVGVSVREDGDDLLIVGRKAISAVTKTTGAMR